MRRYLILRWNAEMTRWRRLKLVCCRHADIRGLLAASRDAVFMGEAATQPYLCALMPRHAGKIRFLEREIMKR